MFDYNGNYFFLLLLSLTLGKLKWFYLNDDICRESARNFLIDLAVKIVVTEIELKVESLFDSDVARVRPSLSVHFAAENAVRFHASDHVRSLLEMRTKFNLIFKL